jgi:proteasome activator subunit 4
LFYIQVREHAAGVLASLMKGADEDLSKDFRERSYAQARRIIDATRRLLSSDYGAMTLSF